MISALTRRMLAFSPLRATYRRVRPAVVVCQVALQDDEAELIRLMEPLFPPEDRDEARVAAERLLEDTRNAGGEYRMAMENGRARAGCQVGPLLGDFGLDGDWILGLWVHPNARGRGIGEALIRNAVEAARGRGVRSLRCHIASTNAPSLGLFRKLGFTDASLDLQERVRQQFSHAFPPGIMIHVLSLDLTASGLE